jgi:hypothetical protein
VQLEQPSFVRLRSRPRRRAWAVLALVVAVGLAGCGERDVTDQREETPKDGPAGQRPPSTGVPEESTTIAGEPGDGRLEDGEGSTTTISGAQPGRPQLDGEPTQEPTG